MRRFGTGAGLAAVVVLALGAAPALAEKGGNGHEHGGQGGGHGADHAGHGQGKDKDKGDRGAKAPGGDTLVVSAGDRTVIRSYFTANPMGPSSLPPGIAKKVARGKPLPPGIAKQQVPAPLRAQLPFCAGGLECITLGADLLILDAVHGVVRDIIRGVVR